MFTLWFLKKNWPQFTFQKGYELQASELPGDSPPTVFLDTDGTSLVRSTSDELDLTFDKL